MTDDDTPTDQPADQPADQPDDTGNRLSLGDDASLDTQDGGPLDLDNADFAETATTDDPSFDSEEEYEEQEWTFGDRRTGEIEVLGMKFKVEEPETDEEIIRLIPGGPDSLNQNLSVSDRSRRAVDAIVVAPAITDHRWEEQMTAKERSLLSAAALNWFGINDFVDQDQLLEAMRDAQDEQNGQRAPGGPQGGRTGPGGRTGGTRR